MSGSRTANFGPNITAGHLASMFGAGSFTEKSPKKPDTNGTTPQNRVPLGFKLKLIAEVKKHDIIWQDLKQKKNKELVNDAWQKIRKTLVIKNAGFCEAHWRRLVQGYCNYVRRGTPMKKDLVAEMAFLEPQIKKSGASDKPSDPEAMEIDPSKTEKPKKVVKRQSTVRKSDSACEAQEASIAILSLLFKHVGPETKLEVRKSLVEVLINVLPKVDAEISEHAKQYLQRSGNVNNIDWSALDVPAPVCKAVWDYKVLQKILKD